jgi:hypothetical protein
MYVSGFFASEPKGHSRKFRMVPDSFVCVWTIEQGNVVRWFKINDDIDDRKPVAQKTVRRRAASARDLQMPQAKKSSQRSR